MRLLLCAILMLLLVGCGSATKPPVQSDLGSPILIPGQIIPLTDVRGGVDGTGIEGRIDHMAFDEESHRLYVACLANGSLEVVDVNQGRRIKSVTGLNKPQGVAISGDHIYVSTGGDGKLHQFELMSLAKVNSVEVGEDADNVRVDRGGRVWVSYGGRDGGGIASFEATKLKLLSRIALPRMPEGFRIDLSDEYLYANLPAGKRSGESGEVTAIRLSDRKPKWTRILSDRAGNFPMVLDIKSDRILVATRQPAHLIALNSQDGSVVADVPCPAQSDDMIYDYESGLVTVIGGGTLPSSGHSGGEDAAMELFRFIPPGDFQSLNRVPLPPHTRTGCFAPRRGRIYVGVPATKEHDAQIREYILKR